MVKLLSAFIIFLCFASCSNDKNVPDVSGIKLNLTVKRFEQDFFALDTTRLHEGLQKLQQKYPGFLNDFISSILGLRIDGPLHFTDEQAASVRSFLKDYQPLKDSADQVFKKFDKEIEELTGALKLLKYYFPKYKAPGSIITFIGPIDAFFQTSFGTQGDIITGEALGIGLQLHMGSKFSYYQSPQGQELYPAYISKTFTPDYIAVNCMKNIIDDMYPDNGTSRPLIEQMVERGKRLFLLDKLLPNTPDHLKLNYTKEQLKNVYRNEAVVWDFFLSNDLLNNSEQNVIKNYIGESPKTQELGEYAPGNIGSFTGWQIVKKYTSQHPGMPPDKVMSMDLREIYRLSKYKPRP